jgi:hypothetical protein
MLFKKIKKFTVLQVTALLLAAVFAMVVTACPEGGIGGTEKKTPTAADYDIGNLNQTEGSVTAVTITRKDNTKSAGGITIHYEGIEGKNYNKSQTLPTEAGSYAVTFDVEAADGWNEAKGLSAGTLVIGNPNLSTPQASDYTISDNLDQTFGSVTAVTVTKIDNSKSSGAVTVYYEGINDTEYTKTQTLPTAVGTYAVTFDVAAVAGSWNAASSLSAGTLTINEAAKNYASGPDVLNWGVSTSASVLTLGLTPGNDTTEINLNWYSSGNQTDKVAQVRFIRGTLTHGYELLTQTETGTVAAASSGYTQHKATVTGLKPGASYVYAVSSDGTNWSDAYNFKVPAATGAYKFAVIADPQLTTGNIDANSRYPAVGTTTAAGWVETMQKIIAKGVSFIASGGDQVDASSGNETEYTNLFAPAGLRNLPLAPVSGNHDNHLNFNYHYNLPNVQTFENETAATEAGRNYFYLYNNILFVVLNTAPYPGSTSAAAPAVERFNRTLTAAKAAFSGKYDWLIVQHHKSTASVADHLADRDIQYYVEAGFERVMSEHKVDFVLAGHDHVYARSYPLEGKDGGKVSVPDTSANVGGKAPNTYTNPGKPIYLTFTTGSGLKYYAVSSDPTFNYNNTLYVKDNLQYPYLGEVTDAAGTSSTYYGSTAYMNDKRMPVSNAAFVQPYIPSYTIAEVNGKTIKFSTYPIATKSGTNPGVTTPYSFNEDTAYDWVEVTKTN